MKEANRSMNILRLSFYESKEVENTLYSTETSLSHTLASSRFLFILQKRFFTFSLHFHYVRGVIKG
jgi:hypothetical protein